MMIRIVAMQHSLQRNHALVAMSQIEEGTNKNACEHKFPDTVIAKKMQNDKPINQNHKNKPELSGTAHLFYRYTFC